VGCSTFNTKEKMNAKETEKSKVAEIAKLAQAIRKVTESVANLFRTLEKPSVKLAIEIDNFHREACKKRRVNTVTNSMRRSYIR
jgi:hypothetical protein